MMKVYSLLSILLLIHLPLYSNKVTSCRHKFREEDWIYCTKFGTPDTGGIDIEIKARFQSKYKSTKEETTQVEVGIYRDFDWEEVYS